MADIRLLRMARVLVHYSLGIKKGDRLSIRTEPVAAPLVREIVREALHAGAFPETIIALPGIAQIRFQQASDEQLSYIPPAKNMKQCFTFKQRKTRRS